MNSAKPSLSTLFSLVLCISALSSISNAETYSDVHNINISLIDLPEQSKNSTLAFMPFINKEQDSKTNILHWELSAQVKDRQASVDAIAKAQDKDFQAAYAILYQSLSNNSPAHQSRQTLAKILFSQQEYQPAEELINQGLMLAPNFSAYKKLNARVLMQKGQNVRALKSLLEFPPLLNDDLEYFELLASLLQLNNSHDKAILVYQSLLSKNTQEARWWTAMGVSLESTGNKTDALSSYQTALLTSHLDSNLRTYSENRISYLSQQL